MLIPRTRAILKAQTWLIWLSFGRDGYRRGWKTGAGDPREKESVEGVSINFRFPSSTSSPRTAWLLNMLLNHASLRQ